MEGGEPREVRAKLGCFRGGWWLLPTPIQDTTVELPRSGLQATPKYHSPPRPSGVLKLAYSGTHSYLEAAVENEGGIGDVPGSSYLGKELAGPKGIDDLGC